MPVRLNGSTSGYTELSAPATAGNNTLTLPTGNGTADQTLVTNGSGTLSWADRGRLVLSTAQNTTSGTSIDFTGIPSWVQRITVMFNGVSTNGSSIIQVQIGTSSGIVSSGYLGTVDTQASGGGLTASIGTGLALTRSGGAGASNTISGQAVFTNVSSNNWVATYVGAILGGITGISWAATKITLSDTLDRVRITTVNGTDTFDAGSVNILIEG